MPDPLGTHYQLVLKAILDGRLVPFFGAGVNLCNRPPGVKWKPDSQFLPSGGELSEYLADNFGYTDADKWDLVRVSQYIAVMNGTGPLYEELRKLFDADYVPTPLHAFFARLPVLFRDKGLAVRYPLIVTTNYDDMMERAFQAVGEPFDVVAYVTTGEEHGKFWHFPAGAEPQLIDKPNEYRGISLDQRPVILKIHGAVDRSNPDRDSYVITEDDYIDYLTRTDISNLVPVTLAAKLRRSNYLFLGYGLRDWNLRVILHRIWGEQKLSYKSWAIQIHPSPIDQEFWRKRDVDILDVPLDSYIAALSQQMDALPRAGSNP